VKLHVQGTAALILGGKKGLEKLRKVRGKKLAMDGKRKGDMESGGRKVGNPKTRQNMGAANSSRLVHENYVVC